MRQVGFDVEVQAMDWSTLTSRRAETKAPEEGGWNVFHTDWISPDLLNPVANIGVSGGCQEKAWFGWPCDEKLEKLREAFAFETDLEKQKGLAAQVQARAMEVVSYIPIGQYLYPIAYRDSISGIIKSPVAVFWNISRK